jgi:phospholipid/cholesterol/gamma-HCH transport system permease protein
MKQDTDTQTMALPCTLNLEWVSRSPLSHSPPQASLILDFALTQRIDSAAVALIHLSQKRWSSAGKQLILRNINPDILATLQSWQSAKTAAQSSPPPAEPFFVGLGSQAVSFYALCIQALSVFTEMVYWGTLGLVHKRDFRKGVLGEQMYQLGFKALGIVTLLSFLIGVVLALQSALFLKAYGAGIFLASMIGWSMLREFGPLLTAIILAGRTGSATTAEIATMGVGEELDALQTMGINPIQFVVVPKFWAITITMPMLSIISTAAGILGGFFVSLLYLDISSSLFWNELYKSIKMKDFMAGFLKSVVFAWLIIWIGSFYGLKVKGGAEAVGRETTASVVTCIFIIIIADALFSFLI